MKGLMTPKLGPGSHQPISKAELLQWMKQSKGPINLLLSLTQTVSEQQALKDFRREKVIFNGVPFIPHIFDEYRCEMFASTLCDYVNRLIHISPQCCIKDYENNPQKITSTILQNSCRTSAGADSFFTLQELFQMNGTILSQRTGGSCDPPITIDLLLEPIPSPKNISEVELKSVVKVWNFYALYDSEVMDSYPTTNENSNNNNGNSGDPIPWLELETIIVDTFNFKTGIRTRSMELITYMPSNLKYYQPALQLPRFIEKKFHQNQNLNQSSISSSNNSKCKVIPSIEQQSEIISKDYKSRSWFSWFHHHRNNNNNNDGSNNINTNRHRNSYNYIFTKSQKSPKSSSVKTLPLGKYGSKDDNSTLESIETIISPQTLISKKL